MRAGAGVVGRAQASVCDRQMCDGKDTLLPGVAGHLSFTPFLCSGSAFKRKWAARVAPLLTDPHWLLVSLVSVDT